MASQAPAWHRGDVDVLTSLPPAFRRFLEENGISEQNYLAHDEWRYIRVSPRATADMVALEELRRTFSCRLERVDWLPDFFRLPSDVKIADSPQYRDGHIYGIDAASGAAVHALGLGPGLRVLDLCCAPGAKLCMIADHVHPGGDVTGVDIALPRLAACKSICAKYGLKHLRLLHGDGTRVWTDEDYVEDDTKGAGPTDPAEAHHGLLALGRPFDRVLVDAECTHDGSVKHLRKFMAWGWDTFERRVLDPSRLDMLEQTQRSLLRAGFGQLKRGGMLVYSTCSFSRRQNEDVVAWLLATEPDAKCVPINDTSQWPCKPGSLQHTIRFEPCESATSALFIAKIQRQERPLGQSDAAGRKRRVSMLEGHPGEVARPANPGGLGPCTLPSAEGHVQPAGTPDPPEGQDWGAPPAVDLS